MKKCIVLLLLCCSFLGAFSQADSSKIYGVFERITNEVKSYIPDTSAVPNDKITRKIIELRRLRGGFNVNEAIEFKLAEEEKDNKIQKDTLALLRQEFQSGRGKRWLDNAVIHIYRQQFTYKELKQLVKFYKTPAGQKFAADFPVIMVKTVMAGEVVRAGLLAGKGKSL